MRGCISSWERGSRGVAVRSRLTVAETRRRFSGNLSDYPECGVSVINTHTWADRRPKSCSCKTSHHSSLRGDLCLVTQTLLISTEAIRSLTYSICTPFEMETMLFHTVSSQTFTVSQINTCLIHSSPRRSSIMCWKKLNLEFKPSPLEHQRRWFRLD